MTTKGRDVLTPHDRRRVAVEAQCVEKTVGAYLDGKKLQPSTQQRVEKALGALGYEALLRNSPTRRSEGAETRFQESGATATATATGTEGAR